MVHLAVLTSCIIMVICYINKACGEIVDIFLLAFNDVKAGKQWRDKRLGS